MFIFSLILAILLLAWVAPVVFDFEDSFNIGYFSTNKDYRTTYSDGYGELNMQLELERMRDDRYYYYLSCHFSSGSSVEIVGLKQINFSVNLAGSNLMSEVIDRDPPITQYSRSSSARFNQDQSIIWSGHAEVQYISNSVTENETIDFALIVQMSWSREDYYNMGLISYVVLFLWFMTFPLGPFILKAIFQPNFRGPLDEETRRKHKKYLDYFKKPEDDQD